MHTPAKSSRGLSNWQETKSSVRNLKQFPEGVRDQIVVSQISVRESQDSRAGTRERRHSCEVVFESDDLRHLLQSDSMQQFDRNSTGKRSVAIDVQESVIENNPTAGE